MKHQILEHVRKVCRLKKLEFGCEVKMIVETKRGKKDIVGKIIYDTLPFEGGRIRSWYVKPHNSNTIKDFGEVLGGFTNEAEIIGLPVHLEHLLHAIMITNEYSKPTSSELYSIVASIDLSKSVEQNLEDPQVCEVISKLLKLK